MCAQRAERWYWQTACGIEMPHSDDYPQSRWEQENQISPSAPLRVPGGIRLHTLWGRLAYQLGGNDGYDIVRTDDLAGTSPGAALKTLFGRFGPAVVLIDEWVAYARQLRDGSNNEGQRSDGGDFDTQFTFAQALTEAAAAVPDRRGGADLHPRLRRGGGRPAPCTWARRPDPTAEGEWTSHKRRRLRRVNPAHRLRERQQPRSPILRVRVAATVTRGGSHARPAGD